ncbi:GNAT family N-acetyltransferase [Dermatophilaceae bacterium Soc4.6]
MGSLEVRPVADDEWEVVAWLWQCFRHDLALVVSGLPYADGRYQARGLPRGPSPEVVGYLAWRPHPKTGEAAPIGFALVDGITSERRSLAAMWVTPVVRREGVGRQMARAVIARHPGPWTVAFQHDNQAAGHFWRHLADEAFGPGAWTETERPVPGVEGAPDDRSRRPERLAGAACPSSPSRRAGSRRQPDSSARLRAG